LTNRIYPYESPKMKYNKSSLFALAKDEKNIYMTGGRELTRNLLQTKRFAF